MPLGNRNNVFAISSMIRRYGSHWRIRCCSRLEELGGVTHMTESMSFATYNTNRLRWLRTLGTCCFINHHPILAKLGRVRQAWVLEQYLRVQQSTLQYIQTHQEKLRKVRKSDAEFAVYTSNVLAQRAIAKNLMPRNQRDNYDILEPVPNALCHEIDFDSIILEGHEYHHDDNGESFTASDLRYELCT